MLLDYKKNLLQNETKSPEPRTGKFKIWESLRERREQIRCLVKKTYTNKKTKAFEEK